jgi:hypothetical protein
MKIGAPMVAQMVSLSGHPVPAEESRMFVEVDFGTVAVLHPNGFGISDYVPCPLTYIA